MGPQRCAIGLGRAPRGLLSSPLRFGPAQPATPVKMASTHDNGDDSDTRKGDSITVDGQTIRTVVSSPKKR